MWNSVRTIVGVFAALLVVAACSSRPIFESRQEGTRAPWRGETEMACLKSGVVRKNPFVSERRSALGGPRGVCGAVQPLTVTALNGGEVGLKPAATLRCPMVPALQHWLSGVVQPAAQQAFGRRVVQLRVIASYGCRTRNSKPGARLSEHGFANAIDIAKFRLEDGREIAVKSGWRGPSRQRAFLRQVHSGACGTFKTVLGPNADRHHHDHFHLDLARHGKNPERSYCR